MIGVLGTHHDTFRNMPCSNYAVLSKCHNIFKRNSMEAQTVAVLGTFHDQLKQQMLKHWESNEDVTISSRTDQSNKKYITKLWYFMTHSCSYTGTPPVTSILSCLTLSIKSKNLKY